MGAEFYIRFANPGWRSQYSSEIERCIVSMATFSAKRDGAFEFQGLEGRDEPGRWCFDARLLDNGEGYLFELYARPASIERDLTAFFDWLRENTEISIDDEDGVASGW